MSTSVEPTQPQSAPRPTSPALPSNTPDVVPDPAVLPPPDQGPAGPDRASTIPQEPPPDQGTAHPYPVAPQPAPS